VAKYCDGHIYVCVSVCLSVREHISITTRGIFTNFSVHVAYDRGSVLLQQGDEIRRERAILGSCPDHLKAIFSAAFAAAFVAKEITQSPITSRSRKDHSVCQASANRNPERG